MGKGVPCVHWSSCCNSGYRPVESASNLRIGFCKENVVACGTSLGLRKEGIANPVILFLGEEEVWMDIQVDSRQLCTPRLPGVRLPKLLPPGLTHLGVCYGHENLPVPRVPTCLWGGLRSPVLLLLIIAPTP